MRKVCLFCSQDNKIVWLSNMADTFLRNSRGAQRFVGFHFLTVLFGCWLAGQTNCDHVVIAVRSVEGTWLTCCFIYQSKYSTTLASSYHATCLPDFFLFRYVYKIHYRNNWTINNLLDTQACSITAVYFYSSLPKYCTTHKTFTAVLHA